MKFKFLYNKHIFNSILRKLVIILFKTKGNNERKDEYSKMKYGQYMTRKGNPFQVKGKEQKSRCHLKRHTKN